MAQASNQGKQTNKFTHFIAFQVNNPNILKNFKKFTERYLELFPDSDLKDCAVTISKSHITLKVLRIPENKELEAIETFKGIASKYVTAFQNVALTLFDVEIQNISGDNKLIYADVDPNGHKAKIKSLCRDLHQAFRERGYELKDAPLFLHCSLFNSQMLHAAGSFRLPGDEYKFFKLNAAQRFGSQEVTSVQLLSMKETESYYEILAEFEFNPAFNSYT